MIENKNIDRLFQEKFRDFEETPATHIWENIASELSGNPRKKRGLWLWIGSIAASLALLITLNNTNSNQTTPETTDTNTEVSKKPIITKTEVATTKTATPIENSTFPKTINVKGKTTVSTISSNPTQAPIHNITLNKKTKKTSHNLTQPIVANSEKIIVEKQPITRLITTENKTEIAPVANTTIERPTQQQDKLKSKINKQEKEEIITQNTPKNTEQRTQSIKQKIQHDDIALTQDENTVNKKINKNKWSITTLAAPMYLSSFNEEVSSIDRSFDKNVKQGVFSKAYGVQVAYDISDRLSVQTGLQVVDYGYKTYDVYVSPSGHVSEFSTINYNEITNIEVSATPNDSPPDVYQTYSLGETGDLTQVFGYIEVPAEAKYKIVTGNFGINAIGGFSTLILNKNEVYIETENFSNEIGNGVSNLNNLNFSGNFGIELDYKLYQNIHFNLTPMIKVHTNTFAKDTEGFNPYALGIYSGLNYRF